MSAEPKQESPLTATHTSTDLDWVLAAAAAADDKLATDIVIIDVAAVFGITGHFVIASGRNTRQVRAIAEEIEERVKGIGGPKQIRIEGQNTYEWVLMDYGDFVVHVFDTASREYYDLDRLWSDQPNVPFTPTASRAD
jgi:ribosome-associated protein